MSIKVIEHEFIKISKFTDIKKKIISREDAEILRNLEIEKKSSMFKWGKNKVSPQQWIGVISLKNTSLEILPKIADSCNEEELMNSLIFMINTVYGLNIKNSIKSKSSILQNGFFELLINIFLDELNLQLNQGLHKEYRKNTANLNCIKGSIVFNKHLHKNLFNKNKFYCKYSTLTDDYLLNQIIKATLVHISRFNISNKTKSKLNIQLDRLKNISIIYDATSFIDKINFNRNNERFKNIIHYCELFLNNIGSGLNSGDYKINSFLIDMNKLFEEFIYKSYKKIYKNNVIYQSRKNYLLYCCSNPKLKKVNLRPDIIVKQDSSNINIIDTKWKIINKFVISSDIYQMNGYISGIPNVKDIILLFPKNAKNDNIIEDFYIKNNSSNRIKIRTIDLLEVGTHKFYTDLQEIIK